MQIQLNTDSWHFRLYKIIISETPPKTLCPYFWSMVGIIVFSPIILLLAGIVYLKDKIDNIQYQREKKLTHEEKIKISKRNMKIQDFFEVLGKIIIFSLLLFVIIVICVGIYQLFEEGKVFNFLIGIGFGILIILIMIGLVNLILFFNKNNYKEKLMNTRFIKFFKKLFMICKEMVISLYNKACPIIEWK